MITLIFIEILHSMSVRAFHNLNNIHNRLWLYRTVKKFKRKVLNRFIIWIQHQHQYKNQSHFQFQFQLTSFCFYFSLVLKWIVILDKSSWTPDLQYILVWLDLSYIEHWLSTCPLARLSFDIHNYCLDRNSLDPRRFFIVISIITI